ncbi:hypothetical protein ScPMuIL_010841 [Solemya velum]
MEVSGTFKVSSVVLGVIAFLLIVGGFVAPGWFVIRNVYVGLWYVTSGRETLFSPDALESNHSWVELQSEATVSVILGLVALICTVVYVSSRMPLFRRTLVMLAAWCYLISASLIGVAVIRCVSANSDLSRFIMKTGTPFSLILCGIGGAIECICAVMHFREYCQSRDTPGVVHHTQPGQGYVYPPPGYSVTVHSTQMAQYPAPMENQPTPADCRDDKYLIQA